VRADDPSKIQNTASASRAEAQLFHLDVEMLFGKKVHDAGEVEKRGGALLVRATHSLKQSHKSKMGSLI